MEGPRSARPDELRELENLANRIFRAGQDQPQTMFQEYADLYHPSNIDNMRIIKEDGKIVANINYLPQEILICGTRLRLTTLGGVCTDADYRGRGHASSLLSDCLSRIEAAGTELLHISGEKPIYINAGSVHVGVAHRFSADRAVCGALRDPSLTVSEYAKADLPELAEFYSRESVRFDRSIDRFALVMDSKKFVHANNIARRNLIFRRRGRIAAYAIMTFKGSMATINEYGGGMETVFGAAAAVLEKYGSESFRGYIMGHEAGAIALATGAGMALAPKRLPGTIRVMDFGKFMTALKPYMKQFYSPAFVDSLRFESDDSGFHFLGAGDAKATLPDRPALNDLVFGTFGDAQSLPDCDEAFADFFAKVFPIPFVYTENLSYS